jgi:hypothetical protein
MPGSLTPIELDGVRTDQEAELDATCLIWRETSPGTPIKATADYLAPETTTVYTGPCFIAPIVSRRDRFDVHGEQQVYQNQYRVLMPWDGAAVQVGDFFTVTVSNDPDFLGRDLTVKDVLYVSDLSLRRLTVIDIKE